MSVSRIAVGILAAVSPAAAALPSLPALDRELPAGIEISWFMATDALTSLAGFPIVFEWKSDEDERDRVVAGDVQADVTIADFLERVEEERADYSVECHHADSAMPVIVIFPREADESALSRIVEINGPTSICSLIAQASRGGDLIHADPAFARLGLPAVYGGPRGTTPEQLVPENAAFCQAVRRFDGIARCSLREAIVEAMVENADPGLVYTARRGRGMQGINFHRAHESALEIRERESWPANWQEARVVQRFGADKCSYLRGFMAEAQVHL